MSHTTCSPSMLGFWRAASQFSRVKARPSRLKKSRLSTTFKLWFHVDSGESILSRLVSEGPLKSLKKVEAVEKSRNVVSWNSSSSLRLDAHNYLILGAIDRTCLALKSCPGSEHWTQCRPPGRESHGRLSCL